MREKIGIRFSCRNKRWGQNAPFREKRLTAMPTVGELDKLCDWGQNKRKNNGDGVNNPYTRDILRKFYGVKVKK